MRFCFRTLRPLLLTAQAPAQAPAQVPPQFEVASVKPSGQQGWQYSLKPTPGSFVATNIPLKYLIYMAYGTNDYQLAGAPAWADDRFDVAAKPGVGPHLLDMLQSLLAERFNLKVHREMRDHTQYALRVARGGVKLPKSEADCANDRADAKSPCGRLSWSGQSLTGRKVSMANLTFVLAQRMAAPVIDETGLAGVFDMTPEWSADDPAATDGDPPRLLPQALEAKFGLKLESRKGKSDTVVIDQITRLIEN